MDRGHGILMTGETITRKQSVGVAWGFVGTVLIVLRADLAVLSQFSINIGDMMVLVAFFSWAVYGDAALETAGDRRTCLSHLDDDFRGHPDGPHTSSIWFKAGPSTKTSTTSRSSPMPLSFHRSILPAVEQSGSGGRRQRSRHGAIPDPDHRVFGGPAGETIQTYHVAGIAVIFTGVWLVSAGERTVDTKDTNTENTDTDNGTVTDSDCVLIAGPARLA